MKFTRELLGRKNQKGVALLLAMFTVMMITYIVMEIIYDTSVEYAVNSQAVSRLKAYYAARSGLQISLLRIKIYNKIQAQYGSQIPADKLKALDMLWQMPFSWPIQPPAELNGVDKDLLADKMKESSMDATYFAQITDEGSKIDLNDLLSPAKPIRDMTKKLLVQVFENLRQNDEEWARAHEDLRGEEIVNNIIDWIDPDQASLNGGDERQGYSQLKSETPLPPNRAFRTVDELRLVAGINDEIYNLLKDRVTVYGMRAINPNHASAEVLKALHPAINDEVIAKIMERRQDIEQPPFQKADEFWNFVRGVNGNFREEEVQDIPLTFVAVKNFRIVSSGEFAKSARQIEAIVFDVNAAAAAVACRLQQDSQQNPQTGQQGSGNPPVDCSNPTGKNNKSNEQLPKGPPRIVYLIER